MGFAGVRTGGFGSLTTRDGVLSICAPRDYFCNLPQGDLVMRMIGHLGSHLDSADPAGSARRLATLFMSGLIAPLPRPSPKSCSWSATPTSSPT